MSSSKTKKSEAVAKPSQPSAAKNAGYKGHKAGSRKETIHELYDREGADTAWTRGRKMKLAEGTLRSWFAQWQRSALKARSVTKASNRPKNEKTTTPEKHSQKPVEASTIVETTMASPEAAVLSA